MFEMFEREGWDDDRCRAYIKRLRSRACQQVRDILTPGIRAFRTQKVALVGPIPDYAPMAAALLPP